MTGELDVIYWDACIFYEYLKDEQADMWKRQAIDECLAKNKERLNRLCTSVVTHVEVVPRKLPPPKEEEYWRLFGSVYFYDIPIDKSVIALSREIRNYYYLPADEDGRGGKMMGRDAALSSDYIPEIRRRSFCFAATGQRTNPMISLSHQALGADEAAILSARYPALSCACVSTMGDHRHG